MSANNVSAGPAGFILGNGIAPQILLGLVTGLVLFIVVFSVESLIQTLNKYQTAKTILVPNTITSASSVVILQDPSNTKSKMILPSENELTGVEFTYSFYLFVDPSTIDSTEDTTLRLKQVFYKGYSKPFPLLGPGVFIRNDTNTMRIFMNSYKSLFNYVDVPNIPMQKWFHCALVFRANNLEVYINGNLSNRIAMEDTYPYQNYQNIVIFGGTKYDSPAAKTFTKPGGTAAEAFKVTGPMSGQISRLTHYRYALSFSEIQALSSVGPSSKIDTSQQSSYLQTTLTDSWYTP